MSFRIVTDERGIPHSHYGDYKGKALGGEPIGTQVSTLYVAENGLRAWNTFLKAPEEPSVMVSGRWNRVLANPQNDPTDPASAMKVMLACADWLMERLIDKGDFAVWEYPYPMSYETPAGWRSGHAQAVALQLLHRTGHTERFNEILKGLVADIDEGGIAERIAPGALWFEKMAHPENQRPKILNGHLFVVIALYDLAARTGRDDLRSLADEGMEAARILMPRFDLDDWSAYSILGKRASKHYHEVVVKQLRLLKPQAEWVRPWLRKFAAYSKNAPAPGRRKLSA